MGLLLERALRSRVAPDFDVARALGDRARAPREINTGDQLHDRFEFLRRSLGGEAEARQFYERVLAGNELQPVNYLERGAIAARAVARIEIRSPSGDRAGWASGFLIAPGVLLTNHHVFQRPEQARASRAQFGYQADLTDTVRDGVTFDLDPGALFLTSEPMDFTVVAVRPGAGGLEAFGWLPLLDVRGKAAEGEWLTIIQHPRGGPKSVCVRENRLLRREGEYLWYSTDTLAGSSGSPVFNNDWYVVALHSTGVPERVGDLIRGLDGGLYPASQIEEEQVKWVANAGTRASRIHQVLKRELPDHPLLGPLFAATPETARIGPIPCPTPATVRAAAAGPGAPGRPAPGPSSATPSEPKPMTDPTADRRTVTVPLEITIHVQEGSARAGAASVRSVESAAAPLGAEARRKKRAPSFDVPFDATYTDRGGYAADFLGGGHTVDLPGLSPALRDLATPLIGRPGEHVLAYHNFSVVMHRDRRLAIYSAANVDFSRRYEMGRPEDVWRMDPRIPVAAQIGNFYYASNQFDRGHLTRREDLEFGATPMAALQSAADTCHWTNCSPQHSRFNQNREIWQGIERHLLEGAIVAGQFRAQVLTGPVFDEGDPEYREIQYPLSYWKVVAAVNASGRLFATAFLASQEGVIDEYGIEAAPEVPFGPFKHFQVRIAEVERLTGLRFTGGAGPLAAADPLEIPGGPRRRSRRAATGWESMASGPVAGAHELMSLDDIITA